MNEETYLEDRLQDQIDWYDRKSIRNQKSFKLLQLAAILASASIPLLAAYITDSSAILKLTVGLLGFTVTAITAVLGLYRFQENWLTYRTTCEALKHEKFLFLTKSDPYDRENAFPLFVEHVENLLAQENSAWYRTMKKEKKRDV